MSKQFKGTVTEVGLRRRYDHLIEKTLKVGAYENDASEISYSTVTVRVPRPTDVSHKATIQLCLHNGASRTFASLTPDDITALLDFLSLHADHLRRSFETASTIAGALRTTDIKILEYLKQIEPQAHPTADTVNLPR